MSSLSSSALVMFFSKTSCSSSATSLAVVDTPTSEVMRISSTLSQNSSSSVSLNSATAAFNCPTNDSRLRRKPCRKRPNHPPSVSSSITASSASGGTVINSSTGSNTTSAEVLSTVCEASATPGSEASTTTPDPSSVVSSDLLKKL